MKRLTGAALCAALLLAGCGGHEHHPQTPAASVTAPTPTSTVAASTTPARRHHRHRRRPDPGRLPQTRQLPSSHTRHFHQEMAALWRSIRSGRTGPAMRAFFPEAAYVQVKAIPDPQGDWESRLVGGYTADIAAAHALLGGDAARARLVGVEVPAGYAHWVVPGTCENRIGYWETPNSRVVYREAGQERSFGIASLISWRGAWYVVHLGAVQRSVPGGTVDDPSSGAGYSAPSSTC